MYVLSKIKNYFVPDISRERSVLFGIYRGLKLDINLRNKLQVYLGLWERETFPYLTKSIQDTEWFIDVGSGDGELCILFLLKSSVEVVYAFDPLTQCTDRMKDDLSINGIADDGRLKVSNKLVGNGPGKGFIKLDEIVLRNNKKGFIKIDVEGAELDVLKSGNSILNNENVNLLIETHSKDLENDCVNFLENLNFNIKIIKNAWWRIFIPEYRPVDHNRWLWATKK